MKSFLEYVADDLLLKHGDNLSDVAVVFPNKRAALFLSEHIARKAGKPVWSPAYITISDLFRHHSQRVVADPIKLVCELHKSFTAQTGIDETLDHFYGWGQLLLADFDDIDKNMADADKVFANLRDLHELDDVSYLSEEQKSILKRFFSNFSDNHDTELRQRFIRLWSRMSHIYHDFNDRLSSQQLAYEGALYREVAEQNDIAFAHRHYVFVGFNLLQRVEHRLFTMLKKQHRASFYWDFDHYYMPHGKGGDNEAGHFIAQYLADFPNELDTSANEIYGNFAKQPRHIAYIAAPTENAQARYISQWLRDKQKDDGTYTRISSGRRTAIVLCNEGLLQTVIHCLPDEVQKVNVTTGYPLIQSPAASLVTLLMNLQTLGYSTQRERYRLKQVNAVLKHPYIAYLSDQTEPLHQKLNSEKIYYPDATMLSVDEGTALLFTHPDDHQQLLQWLCELMRNIAIGAENATLREHAADPLFQESVFRMYTLLNRLKALVDSHDLQVDTITLQRLITQLITSASVPFHGEPIEGLQVMGVLETRNLDFDHLLILSCNEGNMPKGVNDTSFIPYSIRKAYGLTTIDHKVAIYSYYFHRLLQRAADVTILYNNATQEGHTGEMSRFMLQLMVESPHHFTFHTLQAGQNYVPFHPVAVEKSERVMEVLQSRFSLSSNPDKQSPLLSPTAINRYMRCPLQFYYYYVCDLKELDDVEDDSIDNRIFGNIFHEAAQLIYKRIMDRNGRIERQSLDDLLKNRVDIERATDEAFSKELFKLPAGADKEHLSKMMNGLQLINREVIIHYLRQLVSIDRKHAPFTILGLERQVTAQLQTPHLTTTIGGFIDRLDQLEQIRVVDYKTGGSMPDALDCTEAIFEPSSLSKHSDYYLQTFIYSCIVRTSSVLNPQQLPVAPALLFIQHAGADDYNPIMKLGDEPVNDIESERQLFGQLLIEKVDSMFNPSLPFEPTSDRRRCTFCPYRLLCASEK
jgi:CRISPR/Cas system-associated exonuclease Cas4 (RecB family)